MAVEEHQGAEGLILSAGGDVVVYGQVGQEGVDLRRSHVARMPQTVKANEAHNPLGVGLFGAKGIVAETDFVADLVEESRCLVFLVGRGL